MNRRDWIQNKQVPLHEEKFPILIKSLIDAFTIACGDDIFVAYEEYAYMGTYKTKALGADGRIYLFYSKDFMVAKEKRKKRVDEVFEDRLRDREMTDEKLDRFAKGYNL